MSTRGTSSFSAAVSAEESSDEVDGSIGEAERFSRRERSTEVSPRKPARCWFVRSDRESLADVNATCAIFLLVRYAERSETADTRCGSDR